MNLYDKNNNIIEIQEVKKEIDIGRYFTVRKNSPTTAEGFYPLEFKDTEIIEVRCELYMDNTSSKLTAQLKVENNSLQIRLNNVEIDKLDNIGTLFLLTRVILS